MCIEFDIKKPDYISGQDNNVYLTKYHVLNNMAM